MTSQTPAQPGWYYGWNIVAVSVLSQVAANAVLYNCLTLYLPQWSAEFHVPISQILLATTVASVVTAFSAAVIGSLADRKPARWLLGLGLGGLATLTVVGSTAAAAWQVEALYAILLPVPFVLSTQVVCSPLVSRWFVKRLGLALGINSFGIGLGGVVVPPLVAAMIPLVGWRVVWRISALVVALIVLPIVVRIMRDRPTEREGLHYVSGESAGDRPRMHGGGGGTISTRDVLRRGNFWRLLAVVIPLGWIYVGGHHNLAPLVLSHGFDQATAGLLLSILNLSSVISTLIMGLLADRFGSRLPLMILAFSTAVCGILLGIGDDFATLMVGAALMGFAGGFWTIMPAVVAAEFGAANTGRVFGLLMLILPVHALMTPVIARTKEVTGSYAAIFIALGVFCFIGGIIVMLLHGRRQGGSVRDGAAASPGTVHEPS